MFGNGIGLLVDILFVSVIAVLSSVHTHAGTFEFLQKNNKTRNRNRTTKQTPHHIESV